MDSCEDAKPNSGEDNASKENSTEDETSGENIQENKASEKKTKEEEEFDENSEEVNAQESKDMPNLANLLTEIVEAVDSLLGDKSSNDEESKQEGITEYLEMESNSSVDSSQKNEKMDMTTDENYE